MSDDYTSSESEREEPFRKVRFIKKQEPPPVVSHVESAADGDQSFELSPPPRSKRLRFKKKRVQNDSKPEIEPKSENPTSSKPRNTPLKSHIKEWGPSVNGYRFLCVDTPEEHKSTASFFKHSIFYEINDVIKDYKSAPEGANYNYDVYLFRWQDPDDCRINWPVASNDPKNISLDAIEEFLPADELVLKRERIRWHPDKMQRFVRGVVRENEMDKVLEFVTATFQAVNELWERRAL